MKVFFKLLTAVITVLSLSLVSYAQISDSQLLETYENALKSEQATFADLDQVPWAMLPVTELAERGIVSGMGGGFFAPQKSVSRAEFIKLITSVCGLVSPDARSNYSDVGSSHWSYIYVSSAAGLGLTDIYPEDVLSPDEPISREDICYISAKAMNVCVDVPAAVHTPDSFTDESSMSSYAASPIYQLTALGILNGRGDGTFSPKDSATRAESAKIIYNVLKIIEENY